MHFKAVWILYDVHLPEEKMIQLTTSEFRLALRRMERAEAERRQLPFGPHLCEVFLERPLPDEIHDKFTEWLSYAIEWRKTHPEQFGNGPDAPEAVSAYSDEIIESTRGFIQRSISVMAWRLAISCSSNFIYAEHGLFWSTDGVAWERYYKCLHPTVICQIYVPPKFHDISDVDVLLQTKVEEPLGCELLREARSVIRSSLRSALIIGMTAAEVGTKQFIAKLVPHGEWIAFNSPSPPLGKILKNYLPTLPLAFQPTHGQPMIPDTVRTAIGKGIEWRNEAAHQGTKVTDDEVKLTLDAVEALLYYLDYYAGSRWALERARRLTPQKETQEPKKHKKPHSP